MTLHIKLKKPLDILTVIILINSLFFSLIFYFYTPRWETNDDVAMSMIIHGYGLIKIPSTNLVFSNIVWGEIINLIPSINDLFGYSIATALILFLSANCIYYYLTKLNVNFIIAGLITFLIFLRPIIFPQFTLNAGLLSIGFILSTLYYEKSKNIFTLIIAGVLFFLAFIIRYQELLLILLVSLPFLNFKFYIKDIKFNIFLIFLALILSVIIYIDIERYNSDEWKIFTELNTVRIPFTDHKLIKHLIDKQEILKQYSYSINDLRLISDWFFCDPLIFDVNKLKLLTESVEFGNFLHTNFSKKFSPFNAFLSEKYVHLMVIIIIYLIAKQNLRLLMLCILVIFANYLMTLMGRGGLSRVLTPLLSIAVIFSVLSSNQINNIKILKFCKFNSIKNFKILFFSIVLIVNINLINKDAILSESKIKEINATFSQIPNEIIYAWGASLPIEYIYPVFESKNLKENMKIYGLGVFTLAPNTLSLFQENNNNGFIKNIRADEGLIIFTHQNRINKLEIWCSERFKGSLVAKKIEITKDFYYYKVKCN